MEFSRNNAIISLDRLEGDAVVPDSIAEPTENKFKEIEKNKELEAQFYQNIVDWVAVKMWKDKD